MARKKDTEIKRMFLKDGKYRIFGRKVKRGVQFTVRDGDLGRFPLPQCAYLDEHGKRCRCRTGLKLQVHLNSELYKYPSWVEVGLCPEHHVHFGGGFEPKKRKTSKIA